MIPQYGHRRILRAQETIDFREAQRANMGQFKVDDSESVDDPLALL